MTANTKAVLCFVVGLAGGAAATYFLLDAKYAKLLDEKVEEETQAIRKKYTDIIQKYDLAMTSNKNVVEAVKSEKGGDDDKDGMDGYTRYGTYASETDIPVNGATESSIAKMRDELDKVSKDAHSDEFDKYMAERESPEDDEAEETEEEYLERIGREETEAADRDADTHDGPYIISPTDYEETHEGYIKRDWDYYIENEVMVDEEGSVIDHYTDYVGTQFKNWYVNKTKDSEYLPECFIRNDKLGVDYCINPFPETWIFDEELDALQSIPDDQTPFEPEIHISSR